MESQNHLGSGRLKRSGSHDSPEVKKIQNYDYQRNKIKSCRS